jgi:RecB family exonuclease
MAKLNSYLTDNKSGSDRRLSPSLFFTYVECPLKFYFKGVAELKVEEEVSEEVDNALFGQIVHLVMELLYRPLVGLHDPRATIKDIIGSKKVDEVVAEAINKLYLKDEDYSRRDWGGNLMLIHNVVTNYINNNILPFDAQQPDSYTIKKLEEWVTADYTFMVGTREHRVRFHGKADRIDRLADGSLRVVDYKTGMPHGSSTDKTNEKFRSLEALFEGRGDERISAVLQTMLYSMMLRAAGEEKVQPALYYVRNLRKEDYSPLILDEERGDRIEGYAEYAEEFEARLSASLASLFDGHVPFTQTEDRHPCQWCDFKDICQR